MKLLGAVLLAACASATPVPTRAHPVPGCVVSCPDGYAFAGSDTCRGGRRWFTDVMVVGRYTNRGVDGSRITDVYTTLEGDFPVSQTKLCSCHSLIRSFLDARDASKVGVHPGEDEFGEPKEPHQ